MLADAKAAYDMLDAVFEFENGLVVEMIPMVMRDDEIIDVGNVLGGVNFSALVWLERKIDRKSVVKDWVYQISDAVLLYQNRGVPEPDDEISFAIEGFEVCFDGWQRL